MGCFATRRKSGSVVGAPSGEQAARALEPLTVSRAEQAVVADFDEAAGQDMLQQATGVNGGQTNLVTRQSEASENPAHLFTTEDHGQFLFRGRPHDAEDGPATVEGILVAEPDAAEAGSPRGQPAWGARWR